MIGFLFGIEVGLTIVFIAELIYTIKKGRELKTKRRRK
jgi:gas vesicle protein